MYKNVTVYTCKMDVTQQGAAETSWRPSANRPNAHFSLYKTVRPVIVYFSFT